MLDIQGLSKKYGDYLAVDHVSFTVPTGKIGILLGPNGAGKSTIIKSIAGLLRYEGGIGIQKMEAHSMEAKKIFAYVPVEAILTRFELEDKQDKLGNELSKGMMQKVSICCALCIKPQVILLDEPMVGLDPKAIKELKEVILELKENGVTILISTHMLEMVENIWDVMFVMEKGHIIGSYSKEEVGDKELDALFFELTGGEK